MLPAFERDIINVMYDADESCLPQVTESWKTQPSKAIVLPYCLSAREGVCKFHINYDPFTSSIYPLNPRYAQFYYTYPVPNPRRRYDYVLGDTVRTMKEVQLPTTALDAVVLERNEAPGPDFLSIDTQGSELNILIGASRLLETTILAVHVEVEFHPLYEGQPLFGDIYQFLAKYNFDLVDIQLFSKLLPLRGKHGFRGEGYTAHGEALFLKRPETVGASAHGLQLNKLAFIAVIFRQFECAQQCFETTGFEIMSPLPSSATEQRPRYIDFISRLARAVALLPRRSLPLFSDVYPYTQSQARFQVPPAQSLLRRYLKAITPLAFVIRAFRILHQRLKAFGRAAMIHGSAAMIRACWRCKYSGSAVEALFLEFGMKEQYLLAMRNRILDSKVNPAKANS